MSVQRVLVLADRRDPTAQAVAAALAHTAGERAVTAVAAEDLVQGATWAYRDDGAVAATVRLQTGAVLVPDQFGAVFNRLRSVVPPPFGRPADRDYAAMEWHALLLAWLASFACPVVNAPSPRGLGGTERGDLEWLALAAASGLPARSLRLTTNARRFAVPGWATDPIADAPEAARSLPAAGAVRPPPGPRPAIVRAPVGEQCRRALVVGDEVSGAPDPACEEGCRRLVQAAGCRLLEVAFAAAPDASGRWLVDGVEPFPSCADAAAVDHVARLLRRLAAGTGDEPA